jgi:hypothetical protein
MSDFNTLDLHGFTWSEALESFIGFFNDAVRAKTGDVFTVLFYSPPSPP